MEVYDGTFQQQASHRAFSPFVILGRVLPYSATEQTTVFKTARERATPIDREELLRVADMSAPCMRPGGGCEGHQRSRQVTGWVVVETGFFRQRLASLRLFCFLVTGPVWELL